MFSKFKVSSSSSSPAQVPQTPLQNKRRRENDENQPPAVTPLNKRRKVHGNKPLSTPAPSPSPFLAPLYPLPGNGRRHFKPQEKMEYVLDALEDVHWGFAEMMGYAFGLDISRSHRHAGVVSGFLRGEATVTPGAVLHLWDKSADGRIEREENMYSLDIHFSEIKPVRPALTSYAAQKCLEKISRESAAAVKPDAGLHATARKNPKHQNTKLEWQQIGVSTVQTVEDIVKATMPLSFALAMKIAGDGPTIPKPQTPEKAVTPAGGQDTANTNTVKASEGPMVVGGDVATAIGAVEEVQGGKVVAKKVNSGSRRPANVVVTHAVASLLYKRNSEARLLPLSLGLLAFSYSTPVDFLAYCSRIAATPTYTTIMKSLKIFANHQAFTIQSHGRSELTAGFIQMDNVQNYHRIQDQRIGSVNKMNIGLAATYCELPGIDPKALDIKDKQDRVKRNERAGLTTGLLLALIDTDHLDTVISLHWLRLLVEHIPELHHLKGPVSRLFKTRCERVSVCIPAGATPIYPLASSGKSENVTTELKDAMLDFLGQAGQKEGDHLERLMVVGGDGLTFQRLLELQRYLQFHPDSLSTMTLCEPSLSVWHTGWTDLSRLTETFYGSRGNTDPSTLGHSAELIGRPAPPDFKKVDFYAVFDSMSLVLDVRMLDCWRIHFDDSGNIFDHFSGLAAKGALPTLDELDQKPRLLHTTYSTTRAAYMALGDVSATTEWSTAVPLGKEWKQRTKEHKFLQCVLMNSETLVSGGS